MKRPLRIGIIAFCLISVTCIDEQFALAIDILNTAETILFNQEDRTRLGIEVEFKGLSPRESAEKVRAVLGGKIEQREERLKTSIKSYDASGQPIYNELIIHEFEVVGSKIGDILLKPETNQIDDVHTLDNKDQVVELVTAPIRYPEVQKLDLALQELKKAGAQGTDAQTPVSTQVNVEMFEGKRGKVKVSEILDIMRAYLRPEHSEQIENHIEVPDIRKPYIAEYSPGFMRKLLDPTYNPSEREFYDDFVYRQSMEFLGESSAWTDPIDAVRGSLLKKANPVVPEVVKQNRLRISSLLMWLFPDDPMSRAFKDTGWAVARPLIEFREWNNEFNASAPCRQALGLKTGAAIYGYYDHDRLLSELSGVDPAALPKLRKMTYRSKKTGDIITFRYYLGNPESLKDSSYSNNLSAYGSEPVGYLNPKKYGVTPVVIPGESVVLHRAPFHNKSIIGKYNPNLVNQYVRQVLENKYAEYRLFEDYAPGKMPKSELLSKLVGRRKSPIQIEKEIRKKYPKGFVIKGVWDVGSQQKLITDEINIAKAVAAYRKSDFDEYASRIRKDRASDASPEDLITAKLFQHPNYSGWKLAQMFSNPDQSIIQERVSIDQEFRVEVLGGKVIGGASTIDRLAYEYYLKGKTSEYVPPAQEVVKKAESFAQNLINQLPKNLRGIPFSIDVALLKNGSMVMIESNPGGNSRFLYEDRPESIQTLTSYLREYVGMEKRGEVPKGMSDIEQMSFIKKKLNDWKINISSQFPGLQFLTDRIIDPEFIEIQPDAKSYNFRFNHESASYCGNTFSVFSK